MPSDQITRDTTTTTTTTADNNNKEDDRPNSNNNNKEDHSHHILKHLHIEDAMLIRGHHHHHHHDEETHDNNGGENMSVVEKVYTNKTTGDVDLPPDGGYGWVCVFCAGLVLFSTWGCNSSFGVYLSYYISSNTFNGATRMDFAWITGLLVFNAQFWAPFALILDKTVGMKPTMLTGLVINFVGYILASFATELWEMYVCQGVIVGISYSFIFIPATTVVPNWFMKRRALASGLLCAGTGLGGLTYSLSINALIERTGDQKWSLRFVAILTTVMFATAITFIKRRNPPPLPKVTPKVIQNNFKVMFSYKVLTNPRCWYVSLWFAFTLLAYNMTLFSYSSSATAMGLSQHQGSVLTALMNTAQAIGRPTMGFVADAFVGRTTYTMCLNIILVVLVYAFWFNVHTFGPLLACGILLGLCLGVANVMNPVLVGDAFSPEEFSPAWAFLNMLVAFFLLFVEVIALSLVDDSKQNPYMYAQVFAGLSFFVGFLWLIPMREFHVKNLITKKKLTAEKELNDNGSSGLEESKENMSDTESNLRADIASYDKLLGPGVAAYFKRTFHLAKV